MLKVPQIMRHKMISLIPKLHKISTYDVRAGVDATKLVSNAIMFQAITAHQAGEESWPRGWCARSPQWTRTSERGRSPWPQGSLRWWWWSCRRSRFCIPVTSQEFGKRKEYCAQTNGLGGQSLFLLFRTYSAPYIWHSNSFILVNGSIRPGTFFVRTFYIVPNWWV